MQIAVEAIGEGYHSSEVIVTLGTRDGPEEVAVYRGLVRDNRMKAYGIEEEGDNVLVELPRETARGAWRVWMPRTAVFAE